MKRLTVLLILGLVGLFAASYSAVAQSPETTASEVADRETLKAFVEGAKAQLESITDPNDTSRHLLPVLVLRVISSTGTHTSSYYAKMARCLFTPAMRTHRA